MSQLAIVVHNVQTPLPIEVRALGVDISLHQRLIERIRELLPPSHRMNDFIALKASDLTSLNIILENFRETISVIVLPRSVAVLTPESITRNFGSVRFSPGKDGQSPYVELSTPNKLPPCALNCAWPLGDDDRGFFTRQPLHFHHNIEADEGIFISRWDERFSVESIKGARTVWTAGLSTWEKLIAQGILVHGSTDGLGIQELEYLPPSLRPHRWTIYTHDQAPERMNHTVVAFYTLIPTGKTVSIEDKTHFYWQSGSLFEHLVSQHPEIVNGWHSCGPGATLDTLKRCIPETHIKVFLSKHDWQRTIHHEAFTATTVQSTY